MLGCGKVKASVKKQAFNARQQTMKQVPATDTPTKRSLNPLVLIVCVCDKYVNGKLPANDEDIKNIK